MIYKEYKYEELVNSRCFEKNFEIYNEFMKIHINEFLEATPHKGYTELLEKLKGKEYFIVTTNVDNKFIESGYDKDRIFEIHGNLTRTQCKCGIQDKVLFDICDLCRRKRRANVVLFDDRDFNWKYWHEQSAKYKEFIRYNSIKD